ncbi:hypothetical protein [Primorskyibacter sp. S187A]|uniref:hypothetical protein n=1 Tax=Primorskyibacter sp. S187A TaxID=3415130 RepID=UPI003C7A6E5A
MRCPAHISRALVVSSLVWLMGCTGPHGPYGASKVPASSEAMTEARRVVDICARTAPNDRATLAALRASGFEKTTKPKTSASDKTISSLRTFAFYTKEDLGVTVLIRASGERRKSFLCSLSVDSMTIEQGRQLAEVWRALWRDGSAAL